MVAGSDNDFRRSDFGGDKSEETVMERERKQPEEREKKKSHRGEDIHWS